jgi:hypothetical protein
MTDTELQPLFKPNMTQREFLKEALESTDKPVDKIQLEWSVLDDQHEASIPQSKRRNRASKPVPLDAEQRKALDEVFFGTYSGAIGQKALISEFNRKNEKQRLSLQRWKDQKSKQKTPEEYAAMKRAGTLPKPWISTRQIKLYVASQETNQLMQDSKAKSKSRAIVIPEDEQIPFYRMQGDSIVLTGAKDGRHPLVVTLVDVYSRYSLQRAIETNSQGKYSQEASAAAVISIIDAIKKRFGDDAIQPGSRWQFDNGGEFKRGTPLEDDEEQDMNEDTGYFKRAVEAHEPKIRVVYSAP